MSTSMQRLSRLAIPFLVLAWLGSGAARAGAATLELSTSTISPRCDSLAVQGSYAEIEAVCRVRLASLRAHSAPDSLELASVFRWLSRSLTFQGRGKSEECRELAAASLTIRESRLGPVHSLVASSAVALGLVLEARGDPTGARRLYDRAVTIIEADPARDEAIFAESLQLLADLRTRQGDYAGVAALYERALAIRERVYGPRHPKVALTLASYAIYLKNTGDLPRSRQAYEASLAISLESGGRNTPSVARTYYNLGNVLTMAGDLDAAESAMKSAVEIGRRVLTEKPLDLAKYQLGLAVVLSRRHDLLAAQAVAEEALAVQEAALPSDSPQLANGLGVLASILREFGDVPRAEPLMERTLGLYEKELGPAHPKVAEVLAELGRMKQQGGDLEGGIRLLERALAIREAALGAGHLLVGYNLSELAKLELRAGRDSAAEAEATRSLAIQEAALGSDSLSSSSALTTLSACSRRAGRTSEAAAYLDRALAVQKRATGERHPAYDEALRMQGRLLVDAGRNREALAVSLENLPRQRELVRSIIRGLPERQALRYLGGIEPAQDLVLSILVDQADLRGSVEAAWNELAESRALVLDEMGLRQRELSCEAEADTGRLRLATELAEITREMAWSLVSGPDEDPQGHVRRKFLELQERKEHLERRLAEESASHRSPAGSTVASVREVARQLPPGSALVSYLRYCHVRPFTAAAGRATATGSPSGSPPKPSSASPAGSPPESSTRSPAGLAPESPSGPPLDVSSYAALVMAPGGEITIRGLGPADDVELRVARWRDEAGVGATVPGRSAGEAVRLYREAGRRLREAAWDPIASIVAGASHVFIIPDGDLFLVDFATLPLGEDRFLADEAFDLHTATAERDLLAGPAAAVPGLGLLAIGAPDFDRRSVAASVAVSAGRTGSSRAAGTRRGLLPSRDDSAQARFAPLPGAAREIDEVIGVWNASAGTAEPESGTESAGPRSERVPGASSLRLVGAEATEEAFKRYAPGRRVLHLASHGFFLGTEPRPTRAEARGVGGVMPTIADGSSALVSENPLLLSGIVLAGANERGQAVAEGEDGVLTAAEISALDLTGTEWAVLSACASGLGETRAGEGVLGLRRAFQISGASTVIMSLWSVDDEIVRAWMAELYRARWLEHRSTPAAVHEASFRLLQGRRAAAASVHPYYWSGFIASGGWR